MTFLSKNISEKKIVFIDMDGVIVDLGKEIELKTTGLKDKKLLKSPDLIKGIFKNPPVYQGAKDAVHELNQSGKYELFIATSAPWENHESATHKRVWLEKHFKGVFEKKMIITHRKDLLIGDYLIDDRLANGAEYFRGELISFGWNYENKKWNTFPDWKSVLDKLLN